MTFESELTLGLAIFENDIFALEQYLENGVDVNARLTFGGGGKGETILALAARLGFLEMVEYLIKKGADVNAKMVAILL